MQFSKDFFILCIFKNYVYITYGYNTYITLILTLAYGQIAYIMLKVDLFLCLNYLQKHTLTCKPESLVSVDTSSGCGVCASLSNIRRSSSSLASCLALTRVVRSMIESSSAIGSKALCNISSSAW